MVIDGKIQRTAQVKLLRAKDTIWEGRFASLKRFKDDVKEGYERLMSAGISLEGFNDLQEGDIIQAFTKEKQEQSLFVIIGALKVRLLIEGAGSLKEKRKVFKSIKDKEWL
jgi:hypothetical protein